MILLITILILLYLYLPDASWKYPFTIAQGYEIIDKIELYHSNNNKLPQKLDDLGCSSDLIKYFNYEYFGSFYRLSFGASLGESIVYDSITKKWH